MTPRTTPVKGIIFQPRYSLSSIAIFVLARALAACGSDAESAQTSGAAVTESWQCDTAHADWKQCLDNKVQHCHIVAGMDPHFHWGMDCQAQGYTCHSDNEGQAACVDMNKTCSPADHKCDNNTAYNCLQGHLAVEPCGTSKHCHDESDAAHCEASDPDNHEH